MIFFYRAIYWSLFITVGMPGLILAQHNLVVKGIVKDESGNPLPVVNIVQKGIATGTTSNDAGYYTMSISAHGAVLVFSHQGYKSQEVSVAAGGTIDITMIAGLEQLSEVVITATRADRFIESVPQKIKVIGREDIDKTVATDLTDLLKKTAGVDVIQYPGLLSGIGIRGFRPQFSGINQRTLLLIDGRPAGATNLATIDMNNVERIEVLKGPASALYGSQAMGGVVNIITKKTNGELKGRAFAGIGSFGITQGGFSLGGNIISKLDFDASFNSYSQSKDFKLGRNNLLRDAFDLKHANRILWTETGKQDIAVEDTRGDGDTRPNTSYSNYTASARLGYTINDKWRIDAKGDRFYAKNVNTPGDIEDGSLSPGMKDIDRYSSDVIAKGKVTSTTEMTAKFFTAREQVTNYNVSVNDSTTVRSEYISAHNQLTWIGGQWMARQQIKDHFVTIGVDYTRVEQENLSYNDLGIARNVSARSPNFDQANTGAYAQGELNFADNRLNVTAGVRYENIQYDVIGTNLFAARSKASNVVNPSAGVNYTILPNVSLHATFGTGFTTVSVFEIAGYSETKVDKNKKDGVDTVDVWIGNADLKNQQSATVDAGIRYINNKSGITADVTYFHTNFENNVISSITQYPAQVAESGAAIRNRNSYTNAKGTALTGIEFDLSYDLGIAMEKSHSLKLFASGVYILKAEEIREIYLQPSPLTLAMHNVADFTLNYGVSYDNLKWLSTRFSGRYVGRRYDTDWSYYLSADNAYGAGNYADIQYPAFMVLDWSVSVKKKNSEVALMIGNLTDENYYEKRGYNMMGRNYMLKYILHF
ncbi:TonB-dependent receptor [Ohtaekwangia koreensis]|uniref:Vitamin B12 transporter n=1 Tax=Ohtaekwangia koreensis TaxID=688867 RepID=A0A1T5J4U8_9BACT|nr:TonB-dependent receptor [Ohtaekwangia koreensis]SKC46322.1 vitamin B12 transporter [Ohtaekwangia koreensis]